MTDHDRFKLLFGPYKTPRFRYGSVVMDEVRGYVTITKITNAPIPWPIGKRGRGRSSPVVYRDLEKALRRESNQAVAHWWGMDPQTISKWRKALGVSPITVGTSRLLASYGREELRLNILAKEHAKPWSLARRAKVAASRRGKRRPAHVVEAVRQAHLGTKHSKEARKRMSEAHKRRGTRPPKAGRPWARSEDALVRTLSASEVVRRTGRSLNAVYMRRQALGLPDGRTRKERRA